MTFWQRLGILPTLLIGALLFAAGLYTSNSIMNHWWPFDVARIDLVRAVSTGQIEATTLLDAANGEIIIAFLGAVLITITGLTLPLAYLLNKRLSAFANRQLGRSDAPEFLVTLRQAMGIGLWVTFCTWLQMNRALNVAVALLVAAILILFELLLQVRARAAKIE